eukprot:gene2047-2521_t
MIKSEEAISLKEKGNIELWNKNYTQALTYFSEALDKDPNNLEFHLSKASAYNSSGLYSNAIKECKVTVDIGQKKKEEFKEEPDIVNQITQIISKAYARMGTAYMGANQYEESKNCIENAINTFHCDEFEEMLSLVESIIEMTTSEARDLFNLAHDAYKRKNYLEALQFYSEAINTDQNNNILYSNRSMCLNKLKRYQDALQDSEKAIEIENKDNHHSYLPRYSKGNSLFYLGRYQEALESYEDALKNKPDSEILLKRIRITKLKISNTDKKSNQIVNNNNNSNNNNNNNNDVVKGKKKKNGVGAKKKKAVKKQQPSSSSNTTTTTTTSNKPNQTKSKKNSKPKEEEPASSTTTTTKNDNTTEIQNNNLGDSVESNLETSEVLKEDHHNIPKEQSDDEKDTPTTTTTTTTTTTNTSSNKVDKEEVDDEEKEKETIVEQTEEIPKQDEEEQVDEEDDEKEPTRSKKVAIPAQ